VLKNYTYSVEKLYIIVLLNNDKQKLYIELTEKQV